MPFAYWSFDGKAPYQADKGSFIIKSLRKDCPVSFKSGPNGMAAQVQDNSDCWFQTNALFGNVTDKLTLSFYFKGRSFNFSSYSRSTIIFQLRYPNLRFKTTFWKNGKEVADDWQIPLNGSGIQSYDYLADGNWHQVQVAIDASSGIKQIWLDGQSLAVFKKKIATGTRIVTEKSDGFIQFQNLDEVNFYAGIQHPPTPAKSLQTDQSFRFDLKEFAEGHPVYTKTLYQQLVEFPSPRFVLNQPVPRLVSWMNIQYLHRELENPGSKGFGKQDPNRAIALSELLVNKWNYYLEVPLQFKKGDALIAFARSHPEYPVSTISYQTATGTLLTSNSLDARFYFRDVLGSPVIWKNRKWIRPSALVELASKDGVVTGAHLKKLKEAIGREPALINENGEIFGHIRPLELLQQDPTILSDFRKSGLSVTAYSGRMQYLMDSAYKATALKIAGIKNALFSFYNLSAIQPAYWPSYVQRRGLHRQADGRIRSTPDFYPRKPSNWLQGAGAFNGFKTIAAGRKTEIELGDVDFSPFVAAGWGEEIENIRPAQWLALLKAMVMLGAENFYTGYFNITGKGGKWPNGFGPNDPAGYAYQVAMPAYAQAIRTWVPDFFSRGKLLHPAESEENQGIPFCFSGTAANDLILVRQLGKQFLIYGSLQPNSNEKGNVPSERLTSFQLEGKRVTIKLRRQGSVYILDMSGKEPVIRQLDSWHQYEHPSYWASQLIEAAINYTGSKGLPVRVSKLKSPGMLADAESYVTMKQQDEIEFSQLPGDTGSFEIELFYRLPENTRQVELRVELGTRTEILLSGGKEKFVIPGVFFVNNKESQLRIAVKSGAMLLDSVLLRKRQPL